MEFRALLTRIKGIFTPAGVDADQIADRLQAAAEREKAEAAEVGRLRVGPPRTADPAVYRSQWIWNRGDRRRRQNIEATLQAGYRPQYRAVERR